MQRRLVSFLEALFNTAIGFFISVVAGILVYPFFGVKFSVLEISSITGIFTVISILRGYCIRRLFNFAHIKGWR